MRAGPNQTLPSLLTRQRPWDVSTAWQKGFRVQNFSWNLFRWLLQRCLAFQGGEQRGTSSIEQLSSANCKYKGKIKQNPVTGWFGSGLGVEALTAFCVRVAAEAWALFPLCMVGRRRHR